jgi:outer membrane protein OmpA-like peptidoglycan-associated protein
VVVRLRHIHFRLNKTTPRTISHPALDRLVALLRKYPSLTIRVEGHTDNLGKPEYNQWLSEERARSVRAYLLSKGIEANRVVAVGRGATHPIASNKTKVGRRQNRRVEVHFTSPLPADVRIELRKTDL